MLWNITLWPQKADCLFKRTLVKAAKSEPGLCTQSVLHHRNPCQPGSPVVVERERERVRVRVRVHVCVSMWEGLNRGEADGCIKQWERERTDWESWQRERRKVHKEKVEPERLFHTKQTKQHFRNCVCRPGKSVRGCCHTLTHPHKPVSWFFFHVTAC